MDQIIKTKKWIERLNNITKISLCDIEALLIDKRIKWFEQHRSLLNDLKGNDLEKAYQLLLLKLGIGGDEAPIVEKNSRKIVFHSKNFCPSLEACRKLGLDTRHICKTVFEKPTDLLIKQLNPKLKFSRNYNCIRPYASYCEEMISFES
jgi:hypothetical protein